MAASLGGGDGVEAAELAIRAGLTRLGRSALEDLLAADGGYRGPRADCGADAVREVVRSLDPLPAALINSRFDVIETNAAYEEMFWDWHTLPCVHKNLLWCSGETDQGTSGQEAADDEVVTMVGELTAPEETEHQARPGSRVRQIPPCRQ